MPFAHTHRAQEHSFRSASLQASVTQQNLYYCASYLEAAVMRVAKRQKVNDTSAIESLHVDKAQDHEKIQSTQCKSSSYCSLCLHRPQCTCCSDMTKRQSHCHHACSGGDSRPLQKSTTAAQSRGCATTMNDLDEHLYSWTDAIPRASNMQLPHSDDPTLLSRSIDVANQDQSPTGPGPGLCSDHRKWTQMAPCMLDAGLLPASSFNEPIPSMMFSSQQYLDKNVGYQTYETPSITPHRPMSNIAETRQRQSYVDTTDQTPWDSNGTEAPAMSADQGTNANPRPADVTALSADLSLRQPYAVDLPTGQNGAALRDVLQMQVNSDVGKLMNNDFAGFSFDNSQAAPSYSFNIDLLHLPSDVSTSVDAFDGTANQTSNNMMATYPPLESTMLPTMEQYKPGALRSEDYLQDLDNDYKYQYNDPFLTQHLSENIFLGFDPEVRPQLNEFDYVDPIGLQNVVHSDLLEVSPSLTPADNTNEDSGRRDTSRDQELLDLRNNGLSYREIKQKYGFKEAESTLRGRYRTLTKAKEERVRKPEWRTGDINLLLTTVQDHSYDSSAIPPSAFSYTQEGLPILRDESNLTKISWKKVAEAMADQGAYHYGNATVKKKYVEIRKQKLSTIATEHARNSAFGLELGGYAEMYG